jgi:DnaD/phage-associated family protein
MSKLLFDSQPIVIDRKLAKLIGLNEAIVLQQINYWIKLNEEIGKKDHFRDGMWWTYNTYSEWIERNFPFWSESTLIRTIKKLEKLGLIIATDIYNQKKYDNTKWYTVVKDELDKLEGGLNRGFGQEEDVQKASSQNEQTVVKASSQFEEASSQNEQMHLVNLNRPIPETNSEINPEIINTTDIEKEIGKEYECEIPEEFLKTKFVAPLIDPAFERLAKIYEGEVGRPITKLESDSLGDIYDLVGEELTIETLKRAVSAGTRNIRYMSKIAREWRIKGIKSMIDLEREDEKFSDSNKLKKGQSKDNKPKPEEDKPKPNKYEKFYL